MSYQDALLMLACHNCGADPGEACHTFQPYSRPAGRVTSPHASRYYQMQDIVAATGIDDDLRTEWKHRRATERAIRALYDSLDESGLVVDVAWVRLRILELLRVKP